MIALGRRYLDSANILISMFTSNMIVLSKRSSESSRSAQVLRFSSWSYRYAEQIFNSMLALKNEIQDSLGAIKIPAQGISRPQLNDEIEKQLAGRSWETQPRVAGDREDLEIEAKLDFLKSRVGVEVEFGHSSYMGIDLLKFQTMSFSNLDKIDLGVYVVTTQGFQKRMEKLGKIWNGSLSFEKVRRYLPTFKSAIAVPIFVLGIDE